MDPLSHEEALDLLRRVPVAHLAVVEDGRPYVTPMSFVLSPDEKSLLFRTMPGRKMRAISVNPTVCVEVSEYDGQTGGWKSAIVLGEAAKVDDDNVKADVVSLFFEKYEDVMGSPLGSGGTPQPLAELICVLAVSINDMSGMSSGQWLSPRTRPGRL